MKTKNHYYISCKNISTWLAALSLASSAVTRIFITDMKGIGTSSSYMWGQIILPVSAILLYLYTTLTNGRERFYRTSIPVWMIVVYFALSITQSGFSRKIVVLCWIFLLLIGIIYTMIATGINGRPLYLIPTVAALAVIACIKNLSLQPFSRNTALTALPDALLVLGLLILVFALRLHPHDEFHPRWGDRADGRRLRNIPPMSQMIPYLMVDRNGAVNSFSDSFEISEVEKYIHRKRAEGLSSFGITHVLLASYVRTLCKYPALNRFISGQRIYSRGEDIQFCMVVKKEMTIDSPETIIKVHLNPHDTAEDVYRKINDTVQNVKSSSALDSVFDNTAQAFSMLPSLLLKFTVWLLKCLDYFGLLPKFLLEISPFHGSLFFTSMGSLGIPPVYHHLYDFGNLPIFVAFGCKRKAMELQKDGTVVQKKYVDCRFSLDERITDGYYFASFFKHYKRVFMHPEILDNPPDEVLSDNE